MLSSRARFSGERRPSPSRPSSSFRATTASESARRQAVGAAHDLDERAEGRLLAVGRAAPHKDPRAFLDDLPNEFMHEPRFADARLADDVESLDAGADRVEPVFQLLQLAVTSDVGREAAMDLDVKTGGAMANTVEPISLLRLRFAFDVMLAKEARLDHPLDEAIGRLTHDSGTRFG